MSFIQKIGNVKAKVSAWMEEKEQKEFDRLKIQSQLAKQYNERAKEREKLNKEIEEMKKDKLKNSTFGKLFGGSNFIPEQNKQSFNSSFKKKKIKIPKNKYNQSNEQETKQKREMFFDGDPWA